MTECQAWTLTFIELRTFSQLLHHILQRRGVDGREREGERERERERGTMRGEGCEKYEDEKQR